MIAGRAYRDREDIEVTVLDALVERSEEGMTVLELRAAVDADIEAIEGALSSLKRDGLIEVSAGGEDTVIRPDASVVPTSEDGPCEPSIVERIRDRLPF